MPSFALPQKRQNSVVTTGYLQGIYRVSTVYLQVPTLSTGIYNIGLPIDSRSWGAGLIANPGYILCHDYKIPLGY